MCAGVLWRRESSYKDHTCTRSCTRNPKYMHTYIRFTHTMSYTHLSHTPSYLLVVPCPSHIRTHTHTHLNTCTHTTTYLHATHHNHHTPVISLNTSHSPHSAQHVSPLFLHLLFIFIYPSPFCFLINLLTCGVIWSYNFSADLEIDPISDSQSIFAKIWINFIEEIEYSSMICNELYLEIEKRKS